MKECSLLREEYGTRTRNGIVVLTNRKDIDNAVFSYRNDDVHASLSWEPMDNAWKERISNDWWFRSAEDEPGIDPQMYILRRRLLETAGDAVFMYWNDEDIVPILQHGQFWMGHGAIMKRGRPCRCHANSAALWRANKDKVRICTGYALSDDGLWRQHSWCIWKKARSTKIIETTEPRILYYGFVMDDEQEMRFSRENW